MKAARILMMSLIAVAFCLPVAEAVSQTKKDKMTEGKSVRLKKKAVGQKQVAKKAHRKAANRH